MLKRIRSNPVERVDAPNRSHRISARLSPEELDDIVEAYAAGAPAAAVAAEFGVSESAVKRLVRQRGGEIRLQPLPHDIIDKAAALYKSGMSVQAVADQLRVPKSTLLRTLKKHGVQMRKAKH
jgi:transposase-like protein